MSQVDQPPARAVRCSAELSTPCKCGPLEPAVGTRLYGMQRSHPDSGDLQALRIITSWILDGGPCMHLRFADGEFHSILGRDGVNVDGLPFDPDSLGVELNRVLEQISRGAAKGLRLLVGGDWENPPHAKYVVENDFDRTIPWCPSGIWTNGIVSGDLATFFDAIRFDGRPKYLVANARIRGATKFMDGRFIEVPPSASWAAKDYVAKQLDAAEKDAIVLYCAGMSTEVFAWKSWAKRKDLTHLDMGHIFDGAFGVRNRSWLLPEGVCRRRDVYFERYAPVLRGEATSF